MTDPVLSVKTSHGRFYQRPRDGKQVPSITNIIGMKDKPALKYWAARECATFAAQNLDTLAALNEKERIDLIKGAPFRSSGTAAERGDIVHDWIDQYIKEGAAQVAQGQPWRPEDYQGSSATAKNMFKQFGAFVRKYQPEWVASEFTVWSDKHGYAGTGDFICKIKGAYIYGDTKTGRGVYPEVGMQISALVNADYMLTPDGEEAPLPKFDRAAVLHVRPRFARLSPLSNIDQCFKSFLGLRACFDWHVVYSDEIIGIAPKIEAIS